MKLRQNPNGVITRIKGLCISVLLYLQTFMYLMNVYKMLFAFCCLKQWRIQDLTLGGVDFLNGGISLWGIKIIHVGPRPLSSCIRKC